MGETGNVAQRTGFTDSALVRLLVRLRDGAAARGDGSGSLWVAHPPDAERCGGPSFSEGLSQWLGWTDAIALSAALDGAAAATTPGRGTPAAQVTDLQRECDALRDTLAQAIREEGPRPDAPGGRMPLPARGIRAAAAPADFAYYRQRCLARQQAMEIAVDGLRDQVRGRLAGQSRAAARLAAVDGVMAGVLGARERQWLAAVPAALEAHFKRLRSAAEAASAAAEAGGAAPGSGSAWLAEFQGDMQALLLAELAFRFQPIDGLLEALRTLPAGPVPSHHV